MNQLKFKTAGKLQIILEEFIEYTPILQRKTGGCQHVNRLDLQALGSHQPVMPKHLHDHWSLPIKVYGFFKLKMSYRGIGVSWACHVSCSGWMLFRICHVSDCVYVRNFVERAEAVFFCSLCLILFFSNFFFKVYSFTLVLARWWVNAVTGRFLGITGWDPSVYKSNQLHVR